MIASEQSLKTERKANMRKIIAAGCLMAAMTLCVGCSSAKDGSKDTTKATTETKMKVQSKYKDHSSKENRPTCGCTKGRNDRHYESQRLWRNAV